MFSCAGSSLLHRALSSYREWGNALIAALGLPLALASLVAERGLDMHGLQ